MRKYFKRLATRLVTAYANRLYKQAIAAAERRHKDEHDMIFVITDPRDQGKLIVIDKTQFLDLRHRYYIPSKQLTIQMLKNSCWYRTASATEKEELSFQEKTVRRLAFCRELLKRAKLA